MQSLNAPCILVLVALLGGCANDVSCACPIPGKPVDVEVSKGALTFANVGASFSQTILVTSTLARQLSVDETNDCTSGGKRIAAVTLPTSATTPVSVEVTPIAKGSCAITFSALSGGGGTIVAIDVSPGS